MILACPVEESLGDAAPPTAHPESRQHIEKQKTTYTSYAPNEVSKLDDCVVETVGDYVIVCVSEDSSSVQSIIDQYTK